MSDFLIQNRDLVFNGVTITKIANETEIEQSLSIQAKASGIPAKMIGSRGSQKKSLLQELKILLEVDDRLEAGTLKIIESNGVGYISAITPTGAIKFQI